MKKIYLYVPKISELKYRQSWLNDPNTMSHNAGFNMNLDGYNKQNGTITKTNDKMIEWYNKWMNKEPDRYYAYICTDDEIEPVGEVYYYPDGETHSMGILINHKYRGKGYSYPALLELERIAFEKNNLNELSDMVPLNRENAIKVLEKAGFEQTNNDTKEKIFDKDVIVKQLLLTKERYNSLRKNRKY